VKSDITHSITISTIIRTFNIHRDSIDTNEQGALPFLCFLAMLSLKPSQVQTNSWIRTSVTRSFTWLSVQLVMKEFMNEFKDRRSSDTQLYYETVISPVILCEVMSLAVLFHGDRDRPVLNTRGSENTGDVPDWHHSRHSSMYGFSSIVQCVCNQFLRFTAQCTVRDRVTLRKHTITWSFTFTGLVYVNVMQGDRRCSTR
jgi:hypothetical protein